MLTLLASQDGARGVSHSRRDFLRIGSLTAGALALPNLLRARDYSSRAGLSTKKTSVVWLWLAGGPSQIETFDPKPDAPAEIRSVTGAVKTKLPGAQLGGTFERMAANADKFAFVRSFAHSNSGHGGGTHWVMTGYDYPAADNGAAPIRPCCGSMLSRYRGATGHDGLPTFVRFRDILADGPAWLGQQYAPFALDGKARENMTLRGTLDDLNDHRALLRSFDTARRDVERSGLMHGMDAFETQAFDLVVGKARDAFNIGKEDPRLRDQYGPGVGERLLLARRLCEAGVGFVTVHSGGWDMHGSIEKGFRQQGPAVDRAVCAFVADLAERGLEDDILLVITGEFGRTPKLNTAAGRDHWAPLSTLAFAGGGLKMGQVIGESSARAEAPKSRPIGPQDLMATLFHVLGMPADLQYVDPSGRPMTMLNGGKPIGELL
ncbi:MAG TPA: DUF1501 domain-containing protein [Gemmataceae bacterium]|jgi:hypothetical protein|nr:DUF1501 domain-containing protein [Gemmataceae bacterium]